MAMRTFTTQRQPRKHKPSSAQLQQLLRIRHEKQQRHYKPVHSKQQPEFGLVSAHSPFPLIVPSPIAELRRRKQLPRTHFQHGHHTLANKTLRRPFGRVHRRRMVSRWRIPGYGLVGSHGQRLQR